MIGGGGDLLPSEGEGLRVGWRLLAYFGVFALLMVVGSALVAGGGLTAQAGVMLASALAAGWWALRHFEDRDPGALGFHASREAVGESFRGLMLGCGVALAAVALIAVAGGVRWEGEAGTLAGTAAEGARALAFFALPAAAEEALARGYPLQAMAAAWGPGTGLVVSSVGFGLLHLANPGLTEMAMVNLVAAGLLLGVIYLRTGSLWWATGAHLGWNWAHGFVADLPVSGLDLADAPRWEGVTLGPAWLGGGGFGPEGSVVTTGVVLAASAALWWGPWLQPGAAARSARPLAPLPPADGGGDDAGEDEEATRGEGR